MKRPETPKACRTVLLEFSKDLDGEQSPARSRRIERHLRACASCAEAADQIRSVVASCRQMKRPRLPGDVRARAAQRVKALLLTPPRRAARRTGR